MIWAALAGGGVGVAAAATAVWLALRLVKRTGELATARLECERLDARRVVEVTRAEKAMAREMAALDEKKAALAQAADRDAVIAELQGLLDECRDPVVVRARLSDILSRRTRLAH